MLGMMGVVWTLKWNWREMVELASGQTLNEGAISGRYDEVSYIRVGDTIGCRK
jgi:hypothetical protein